MNNISNAMDEYLLIIAQYSLHPFKLSENVKTEVKKRIIDTFGVAIAALPQLKPYFQKFPFAQASNGSSILGADVKVSPDHAAFFNGFLARYLDFNDTYLSREPQHPSDVIMPLLALAEFNGNSGAELIEAIAVAYEIDTALCDWASLKANGWDHVNYIGIATAAAASRLLKLTLEQAMNAISVTVTSSIATRQTRTGEISMWKGAAAANSARNAIFSTLIASTGVTGPREPFTGPFGFINQLLQREKLNDRAFDRLKSFSSPERILDTHIKVYPVEYMAQGAIEAVLSLDVSPAQIKRVLVETFEMAYSILAKDSERWKPETRETADHSLPYLVARALFDKTINEGSFTATKIKDPGLRKFIEEKVEVQVNKKYSEMYPEFLPTKVRLELKDGKVIEREVLVPRGHAKNPLTTEEVLEKFRKIAGDKREFLDLVLHLEEVKNLDLIFKSLKPGGL